MRKLLFFILIVVSNFSFGQNLEKIGKDDMMKMSGSINFTNMFYYSEGMAARRDPWQFFASGNLNFTFLDWSIPVSYAYSNGKGNFSQPFNRFSIAPSYKWVKTYIGYQAMSFSNYTLAGHLFLGGGIELTPGKWKISALYGRLREAQAYDEATNSDAQMSYRRMGMGLMTGYKGKKAGLNVILFHAKDDAKSIPYIPINTNVNPLENLVSSLQGNLSLSEKWSLEGEYALSILTRNNLSEINDSSFLSGYYPLRSTTSFLNAYKTGIKFQEKNYNLQLNYEHIDPDYQTLGGYYFNNDLENYTLSSSFQLAKGKINTSLNSGLQRNNLDANRASTTLRWIGSVNSTFIIKQNWNVTGSFSNFSTFTRNRIQPDPFFTQPTDTLNFYQVSRNANFTNMIRLGKNKNKHVLLLTLAHMISGQQSGALEGNVLTNNAAIIPVKMYNGNLSWTYALSEQKMNFSGLVNANIIQMETGEQFFWGPGLNWTKSFKNNLRLMAGSTYNQSMTDGNITGKILNHRFTLNYSPKMKKQEQGKPALSLTTSVLQKLATVTNGKSLEVNGQLSLVWGF